MFGFRYKCRAKGLEQVCAVPRAHILDKPVGQGSLVKAWFAYNIAVHMSRQSKEFYVKFDSGH